MSRIDDILVTHITEVSGLTVLGLALLARRCLITVQPWTKSYTALCDPSAATTLNPEPSIPRWHAGFPMESWAAASFALRRDQGALNLSVKVWGYKV